jgi:hypothetical protein
MYIPFDEKIVKNDIGRKGILILIIIFPILFGLGMYWLRTTNYSVYEIIGREDHLIEWLQFFLFGVSGIIAFLLALKFKKVSKLMFFMFLIVSLGLIFVAGEEISWGQRIFNIQAPEIFDGEAEIPVLEYNVQSEMNLHNFKTFHNKVGYMYLVIGAYACFAWLLVCIFDKLFGFKKSLRKFLPFFVSPPYLFFYFLPLGINLFPRGEWGTAPQDYEMVEFLFSLGLFICLLLALLYFKEGFGIQQKRESK